MNNNAKMKYYLSKNVFPLLFEKGFLGKYPHFSRVCDNCVELLSIQTNKWGGSFTIEVSAVFPESENKNYTLCNGVTVETFGVEYPEPQKM